MITKTKTDWLCFRFLADVICIFDLKLLFIYFLLPTYLEVDYNKAVLPN